MKVRITSLILFSLLLGLMTFDVRASLNNEASRNDELPMTRRACSVLKRTVLGGQLAVLVFIVAFVVKTVVSPPVQLILHIALKRSFWNVVLPELRLDEIRALHPHGSLIQDVFDQNVLGPKTRFNSLAWTVLNLDKYYKQVIEDLAGEGKCLYENLLRSYDCVNTADLVSYLNKSNTTDLQARTFKMYKCFKLYKSVLYCSHRDHVRSIFSMKVRSCIKHDEYLMNEEQLRREYLNGYTIGNISFPLASNDRYINEPIVDTEPLTKVLKARTQILKEYRCTYWNVEPDCSKVYKCVIHGSVKGMDDQLLFRGVCDLNLYYKRTVRLGCNKSQHMTDIANSLMLEYYARFTRVCNKNVSIVGSSVQRWTFLISIYDCKVNTALITLYPYVLNRNIDRSAFRSLPHIDRSASRSLPYAYDFYNQSKLRGQLVVDDFKDVAIVENMCVEMLILTRNYVLLHTEMTYYRQYSSELLKQMTDRLADIQKNVVKRMCTQGLWMKESKNYGLITNLYNSNVSKFRQMYWTYLVLSTGIEWFENYFNRFHNVSFSLTYYQFRLQVDKLRRQDTRFNRDVCGTDVCPVNRLVFDQRGRHTLIHLVQDKYKNLVLNVSSILSDRRHPVIYNGTSISFYNYAQMWPRSLRSIVR